MTATGPMPTSERALGLDVARGLMLLLIALANSHFLLSGEIVQSGFPLDGSLADRVVGWAVTTFVDARAYPLFGLLVGYGVVRIAARQARPRITLVRRAVALFAIGVVHLLLLYSGDVLTTYAVLVAVAGTLALGLPGPALLGLAGLAAAYAIHGLVHPAGTAEAITFAQPWTWQLPPDLGTQLDLRVELLRDGLESGARYFAAPFLVGMWAGRRRILEQPERHRRLLRTVAAIGIAAAALGSQPLALPILLDEIPDSEAYGWKVALHVATGLAGGFGYAALIVLLVRDTRAARVLAATGRRSMTCYVLQSVVWAVVFTPYLLGLSFELSATSTALLATATWAATVAVANALERAGRRGPLEALARRVTYARAQ